MAVENSSADQTDEDQKKIRQLGRALWMVRSGHQFDAGSNERGESWTNERSEHIETARRLLRYLEGQGARLEWDTRD